MLPAPDVGMIPSVGTVVTPDANIMFPVLLPKIPISVVLPLVINSPIRVAVLTPLTYAKLYP